MPLNGGRMLDAMMRGSNYPICKGL